ncbi:MAG: transcription antitermination factor NusB [Candidatus Kapaibacterium sp.]|nr:transcription antitermination factor NusB [Ignavibacteriota bacterium]MCB9220914.1 transcription antitermination factor NusB [Ignavibacteria bacterium]
MNESNKIFPLSNKRSLKGNRRLAREKVLQIIMAYYSCESDLDILFDHIFYRVFYFGDEEETEKKNTGKFLRPEEILELESDIPIHWRDEDIDFGKTLANTIVNKQEYLNNLLEEFAQNWEIDRIAKIDRYLVQSAICELIFFEEIPPKVSINEAIEISKKYSTDRSKMFVNGILDSILKKLGDDGKINKSGRGLNEG